MNAITLLNATDGGQRRCILVTNNEVSADEVSSLLARGVQRGSNEWERYGICRSVTFPRCKFVINGKRDDGTALAGEYLTGQFEEREVQRAFRSLRNFSTVATLASKNARKALAVALGFAVSKVTGQEPFLLDEDENVAVLLAPEKLPDFIELGQEWAEGIECFFTYHSQQAGGAFTKAKTEIAEAWPQLNKRMEVKRLMKGGLPCESGLLPARLPRPCPQDRKLVANSRIFFQRYG